MHVDTLGYNLVLKKLQYWQKAYKNVQLYLTIMGVFCPNDLAMLRRLLYNKDRLK